MDTSVLGETAARCMDTLESAHLEDAEIEVVMIILSVESDNKTFTRTFCSRTSNWEKLGILHAGIDCVLTGDATSADEDEDDEDE